MAASSNELQLVIRAIDEASGVLQRARTEVADFSAGATHSLKQVEDSSRKTESSFQGFMQAFGAQQVLGSVQNGLSGVVTAANETQAALMGLATAAQSSGTSADAATTAAKSLASNGLMSVSDAALGLKNLLATHFNLDQAVQIMNVFSDSAAFGRQAALGYGESIVTATEGIKNQNEILLDNAGISTNATQLIKRNGGAMTDFSNIAGDATTRLRLLNGLEQEHGASAGNADTFAGSQAKLSATLTQTKTQMGVLVEAGLKPLIDGLSGSISRHEQFVVAAGMAGAAAIAFAALIIGIVGAVALAVAVLGGPLTLVVLAVSAVIGGVLYAAIRKVESQFGDLTKSFTAGTGNIASSANQGFGSAAASGKKLADQLQDISDNIQKADRDFAQSLASILQQSQTKIAGLQQQVDRENASFTKDQQQKADDYKKSMQDMSDAHGQRVDDITRQLNDEELKGRFASLSTIQNLKDSLTKENADYAKSTADRKSTYDRDVANAQDAHNQKISDLQLSLQQEKDMLAKHAADLHGISASMALDQISQLKQSHSDQLTQFAKQKADLIANAQQTSNGIAGQMNSTPGKIDPHLLSGVGANIGSSMAKALGQAFLSVLTDFFKGIGDWIGKQAAAFASPKVQVPLLQDFAKVFALGLPGLAIPGFASGVHNFGGGLALVGEQGPELVSLPRGSNVYPSGQSQQMLGGGGVTIHQTNHNYSNFDLTLANRELGWELARA